MYMNDDKASSTVEILFTGALVSLYSVAWHVSQLTSVVQIKVKC